jgi:16S rRNA (cytosine967-C5)-methyltransferase
MHRMKTTGLKGNGRFAAAQVLTQLNRTRLPLSPIFERLAADCRLNETDRQLAKKITNGVLRNKQYLEHILESLCTRPLGQLKPLIRQVLLSGLYQLIFLDRLPPSAVVNESVKIVKAAGFPKQLQGFVNGVLRASLRRSAELPRPNLLKGESTVSQDWLNHPVWMTERWQSNYGKEAMLQICAHNNREPQLCLRANSAGNKAELIGLFKAGNITFVEGKYAPDALLLPGFNGRPQTLPGFAEGLFQVQDQAAQLATLLLAPFPDRGRYLDCCAGLGGKTSHMAMILQGTDSDLSAIEPDPARYALLRQNLHRAGASFPIAMHRETLETFAGRSTERFDRILLDAPCSGTGVIGRRPDIRWNRDEHDLSVYAAKQLGLLKAAAGLLADSGVLVYVTCSIEPEENERVVEQFLQEMADFSISKAQKFLPDSAQTLVRGGFFAPLPAPGIDGFFGARLVKAQC